MTFRPSAPLSRYDPLQVAERRAVVPVVGFSAMPWVDPKFRLQNCSRMCNQVLRYYPSFLAFRQVSWYLIRCVYSLWIFERTLLAVSVKESLIPGKHWFVSLKCTSVCTGFLMPTSAPRACLTKDCHHPMRFFMR